jgi:hypothetical protein
MHAPAPHHPASFRVRYPLRAKLAIAAAALVFLAELAVLALWMMPMVPLVPVFIAIMLGNGFVLASVVEWAASLARNEQIKVRRASKAAETAQPGASHVASAT